MFEGRTPFAAQVSLSPASRDSRAQACHPRHRGGLQAGSDDYDVDVVGLIARRHKRGISYEVRRRGQHAIHVVIGTDTTLTPGAAKQKARKVLGEHDAAKPIKAGKRITVKEGWKLYKEKRLNPLVAIGKRSPRTISTYEAGLARLSAKVRRMTLR